MKGSSRKPLLSDWQLLVRIIPRTAHTHMREERKNKGKEGQCTITITASVSSQKLEFVTRATL